MSCDWRYVGSNPVQWCRESRTIRSFSKPETTGEVERLKTLFTLFPWLMMEEGESSNGQQEENKKKETEMSSKQKEDSGSRATRGEWREETNAWDVTKLIERMQREVKEKPPCVVSGRRKLFSVLCYEILSQSLVVAQSPAASSSHWCSFWSRGFVCLCVWY